MSVVAERSMKYGRSYVIRDGRGTYLTSLSFRDACALEALGAGRVHWRMRRVYSPWFYDQHLEPECDDFGVGTGTLSGLLSSGFPERALMRRAEREGPARLTPFGRRVLAAVQAIPGVSAPAEVRG